MYGLERSFKLVVFLVSRCHSSWAEVHEVTPVRLVKAAHLAANSSSFTWSCIQWTGPGFPEGLLSGLFDGRSYKPICSP